MSNSTRHSAILIGSYFATSFLNYVFGVALGWFFTPAQFGVLGVAQSLLLLIALAVGSGFAWTANHDIAANGLTEDSRLRVRTALLVNLCLALVLAVGLWGIYATGLLALGDAYRYVVPLVGLTTVLLAVRAVLNGLARGLHDFSPVAFNLVAEVLVKALLGLSLAWLGIGVTGIMLAFALGAAVSLLHSLWITRRSAWWRGIGWLDISTIRRTLPLFAGMVGTALMLNLDVLGLKLLSPLGVSDQVSGIYQAAVILARTPVYIAQALTLVLFSYVASANIGGRERASEHLQNTLRSWFRLLLPGSLALIIAPQAALHLFFPQIYAAASASLQVAAIGALLLALLTLLNAFLQATGDRRPAVYAVLIGTSVQIGTMIWLVPGAGAIGAAWALLLGSLVALIAILPAIWPYLAGWRKEISLPSASRAAIPLLALIASLATLPAGTRLAALINYVLSGTIYLSLLLILQRDISPRPTSVQPRLSNWLVQFLQVFLGS